MTCAICGEPCRLTHWGPIGSGGVCRYPEDPNQDDQGQHIAEARVVTGRDAEREQLAAALGFRWEIFPGAARAIADALLPVVDRIANERAAAALEAAAEWCRERSGIWPAHELRDRAAALRASNGAGTTT